MDSRGGGGGGNRNRTDLLAAGRQKLQQFRKKKGEEGSCSVAEIEGMTGIKSGNQNCSIVQKHLSADDHIKSVVNQLVAAIKFTQNSNEGNTKELKATALELKQELQEKHIQISTISAELASQLREAECSAKQLSVELETARMEVHNLEKQLKYCLIRITL
ncbi:hypothetical protein GUJ93_ZPchr0002g25486 [Zizania palustris]|uniref:Uncharacterized protein n=1 Tax=Zizania palustris TaxID=103762 RepID=A0A8J5SN00_ZIZPA|nr:hypothetical protein GUJ93_ZPchr0002g25486 [Zizania palustris]